MQRLIMLAACLAFAASAPAMAGTMGRQPMFAAQAQPDSKGAQVKGGIVAGNGGVVYGSGFQVSHPQTGVYEISFGAGEFKRCPVMSVLPAGGSGVMPNLYYYSCNNSGLEITIEMENYAGTLEDNAFHFTAITP